MKGNGNGRGNETRPLQQKRKELWERRDARKRSLLVLAPKYEKAKEERVDRLARIKEGQGQHRNIMLASEVSRDHEEAAWATQLAEVRESVWADYGPFEENDDWEVVFSQDERNRVIDQSPALSSAEKQVLKLHLDGYSHRQISRRIDVPKSTVGRRLKKVGAKVLAERLIRVTTSLQVKACWQQQTRSRGRQAVRHCDSCSPLPRKAEVKGKACRKALPSGNKHEVSICPFAGGTEKPKDNALVHTLPRCPWWEQEQNTN